MKKPLTLLLCTITILSFIIIGKVPSVTGTGYCNNKCYHTIVSSENITETLMTIQNTIFLVDNKKMMSYYAPSFECQIKNKKNYLLNIMAKFSKNIHPISTHSIYSHNYSPLLSTFTFF